MTDFNKNFMITHGSAYSTTTTTTTHGSTRGFMSFLSQSIVEGSDGPSLKERLTANLYHLSTNMNRYTGFPVFVHNVSMLIRLIQILGIFLFPSCSDFWSSNSATHVIIRIITVLLHFCFFYKNEIFHEIFIMILFVYFLINAIFEFIILMKNPLEKSHSNGVILYINVLNIVLIPITSLFTFSCFGNVAKSVLIDKYVNALSIVALVLGFLAVIIASGMHFLSFMLIRNAPRVNFSALCRPWGSYITLFFIGDSYVLVLAFLEELLPLNNKWMILVFSFFVLIFANPVTVVFYLRHPVFNDFTDSRFICTVCTVGFWSLIMMNIRAYTSLNPTIVLSSDIIVFVVSHFTYTAIASRIETSQLMKLYSVYKQSQAVLPPTSPFIFSSTQQNQIPLSQEAYNVTQAFLSLDINTSREFQMIAAVGACARMPAVRNIDFIRWGLNYFNDDSTLFMCSQICNYFRENAQTQTVLLQHLKENINLTSLTSGIISILDYDHTDVISDNPGYLKLLKNKAIAAQARCRKFTSSFWNNVLNHSIPMMKDSLCRSRDAINEAQTHYDELMRCYPLSLDSISLYLSFLIETKASFIKCHDFINETSSRFIEKKSEAADNGQTIDSISILMKETNKSYSEFLPLLSTYAEQERRVKAGTGTPSVMIWLLVAFSFLFIIGFTVAIIVFSLQQFRSYPNYLKVISTGSDVIIQLASLTLSSRRICLFSKNLIDEQENDEYTNVNYDDMDNLKEYVLQQAQQLPYLANKFFVTSTINTAFINQLTHYTDTIYMFGQEDYNASLATSIEIMSLCIRNLITNIPAFYESSAADVDYNDYSSVCNSAELKTLAYNIKPISDLTDAFIQTFKDIAAEQIDNLGNILYWAMIVLPIAFIAIFGIFLWIIIHYIKSESRFRMTLYLSFPEQVASKVIHRINAIEKKSVALHPESIMSSGSLFSSKKDESHVSSNVASAEETKSKAITIESLYQFSTMLNLSTTTGATGYCISMIIFLIFGAGEMFGLAFYARYVNNLFTDRSIMVCDSAQRYSSLQYAILLAIETYNYATEDIKLFDNKTLTDWAIGFIEKANEYHKILTYGGDHVSFDYREYDDISTLFDGTEINTQVYEAKQSSSASGIQHDGYKNLGLEARIQVLITATSGILDCFLNNESSYNTKSDSWKALNHLLLTHVSDDLIKTTSMYLDGVNNVIDTSFTISLTISIAAIIVLLIIFLGPILHFSTSISQYFDLTTQLLSFIQPEVFERTIYVQKWLQGEITRRNYTMYEATFKRTVSQELQSRIARISPEKVILFTSEGDFIDIGSIDTSSLQEKDLKGVLSLFFDISKETTLINSIQRAFVHFHDAKDVTDNVVIHAKSKNGTPMAINITGITSADSVSIMENEIQNFYALVALLIIDETVETEDERKYQEQRAITLELLETAIPKQFAEKIHNGEPTIYFSAGIGTVLEAEICNYQELGMTCEPKVIRDILSKIRCDIGALLQKYTNLSCMSIRNGRMVLIAGLFNEEQNGRTEAEDSINFTFELDRIILKIAEENNIKIIIKYGASTGGPIYCRVVMETAPIILIDGDVVEAANMLLERSSPRQMMFERTTLECGTSIEMDPVEAGQFTLNGRAVHCYTIKMEDYD